MSAATSTSIPQQTPSSNYSRSPRSPLPFTMHGSNMPCGKTSDQQSSFKIVLPDGSLEVYQCSTLTAAKVLKDFPGHILSLSARRLLCLPPETQLLRWNTYYLHKSTGAVVRVEKQHERKSLRSLHRHHAWARCQQSQQQAQQQQHQQWWLRGQQTQGQELQQRQQQQLHQQGHTDVNAAKKTSLAPFPANNAVSCLPHGNLLVLPRSRLSNPGARDTQVLTSPSGANKGGTVKDCATVESSWNLEKPPVAPRDPPEPSEPVPLELPRQVTQRQGVQVTGPAVASVLSVHDHVADMETEEEKHDSPSPMARQSTPVHTEMRAASRIDEEVELNPNELFLNGPKFSHKEERFCARHNGQRGSFRPVKELLVEELGSRELLPPMTDIEPLQRTYNEYAPWRKHDCAAGRFQAKSCANVDSESSEETTVGKKRSCARNTKELVKKHRSDPVPARFDQAKKKSSEKCSSKEGAQSCVDFRFLSSCGV